MAGSWLTGSGQREVRLDLVRVWAPVWRRFRARPVPERFLSCDDGTVVVTWTYVAQPPDATAPLEAAFAHMLALRDGQVCELRQNTDTHRWAQAAAAADAEVVLRLFAAVEERDGEAVLEAYATDVVIREAPSLPYGGVYHGHDGALRDGLAYTATWDHQPSAEDRKLQPQIRGCDDRVVVTWRHVERDQTRAVLTLCDPERLNPLSAGLTMQLQAHLMDLAADPSLSSEYSSAEHSSAQGWPRRADHGRHRGTVSDCDEVPTRSLHLPPTGSD